MSHNRSHSHAGLVTLVIVAVVYLGIYLWCKLTGEKAEFES